MGIFDAWFSGAAGTPAQHRIMHVGTKIKMTPHINDSNEVRLDIEEEISELSSQGNRATMRTAGGQQLLTTTLLPAGATPTGEQYGDDIGRQADGDPMTHRLRIEAPGNPRSTRSAGEKIPSR